MFLLFPPISLQSGSMAKEEAFHGNIGWIVRFMGAFPVKRGEGDRQSSVPPKKQLKKGKVFFIFPEGTRSKTIYGKGTCRPGHDCVAFGRPVVPVAVWGSEHALKKFRRV